MSTRKEVLQRKGNLKHALDSGWRKGTFRPGDPAPSFRELAQQYNLSRTVVTQVLQELVQEGVLYTVPSVGTYFGQPSALDRGFFLVLFPYNASNNFHFAAVQSGFEEFIAKKGGACLSLTFDGVLEYQKNGSIPNIAGVFEMREGIEPQLSPIPVLQEVHPSLPCVHFVSYEDSQVTTDSVAFDNFDGGYRATQHLIQLGHKKIAFMGVHKAGDEHGASFYSIQRAKGWEKAMEEAGLSTDGLLLCPPKAVEGAFDEQCLAAKALINSGALSPEVTALVTVTACVVMGVFEALQIQNVSGEKWPTIVSFDDALYNDAHVISSMRLPWRELGQQAAHLLWERSIGQLPASPHQELVAMQLIPRLTSQPSWARSVDVSTMPNFSVTTPT